MAKIEYVGKKDQKTDNVAGTETVWNGAGDVHEVSDPIAVEKLLAHPDVWRLAAGEPKREPKKAKPVGRVITNSPSRVPKKEQEQDEDAPPVVNFGRLNTNALAAYAKRHFNVDVDRKQDIQVIRAEVAALAARATPVK